MRKKESVKREQASFFNLAILRVPFLSPKLVLTEWLVATLSRARRFGVLALLTMIGFSADEMPRAVAADATPGVEQTPLVDVDALAARMKARQDLYRGMRDEALVQYGKRNPVPAPYDDQVKTVIRLFAYLFVWDDFYGEGLGRKGVGYARNAMAQGARDPLLQAFIDSQVSLQLPSSSEKAAQTMNRHTDQFLAGDYPAAFKCLVCRRTILNLARYRSSHHVPDQSPSMIARSHFIEKWGESYRELLKQKFPHDLLFYGGESLQHSVESDETALNLVIAEQDRDFNEVDPGNPVKLELDGNFYVTDAWNARGSDWGYTVTVNGAELFRKRLAQADKILEPLYAQYPDEVGTCFAMLNVELGQGQGRDRMERWFQRGIKADPDTFHIYNNKELYLLPRWYGSVDDAIAFGKECVRTGNWAAKIPLIFPLGISESVGNDPNLYKRPDVWALLEIVYREYLARFPHAVFYRTDFAKHAYDADHKDIAREQFEILDNEWDRSVLSNAQYAAIMAGLNAR